MGMSNSGSNGGYGGSGGYDTSSVGKAVETANNFWTIFWIIAIVVTIIIIVACIFGCRYIAKSKNLSTNYMWFGLLGIIGLIIVIVIKGNYEFNSYASPTYEGYNNQNMYNNPQGINSIPQPMAQMPVCPNCGAGLAQTDIICNNCGNKVR